jgi:hypothetical protein
MDGWNCRSLRYALSFSAGGSRVILPLLSKDIHPPPSLRIGGKALHPGVSHLLIRPVTATIVLLYTSNVYLIHSTFSLFTRISILQEDRPFLVGVDLFFFFSSWASHNYWEMVNGRSISFVVVLPLIMAKGQGIYIRGWGVVIAF